MSYKLIALFVALVAVCMMIQSAMALADYRCWDSAPNYCDKCCKEISSGWSGSLQQDSDHKSGWACACLM